MALQNIGASNADDAFYRYKMPRLVAKIEGRGNGIRTNLVNMVDVAKALARPASYTTKFFGCELGAQSKFDEKTGTSIVNGAHDTKKLVDLLEVFIKKFVQCYACGNPETEVIVEKNQTITMKCKACGHVSDVDMRHKLTTFILKNPPEKSSKKDKKDKQLRKAEKERLQAGEAVDEEEKKRAKEARRKRKEEKERKKAAGEEDDDEGSPKQGSDDNEEAEEVQWLTDTSASAVKKRIQEQLTAVTSELVTAGNGVDEETENGSKKKDKSLESPRVKTPRSTKSAKSPRPPLPDVAELSVQDSKDKLVEDLKVYMQTHDTAKTLVFLSKKGLTELGQAVAIFEALFADDPKGIAKRLPKKKDFFNKFEGGSAKQKHIMGAIEYFYGVTAPEVGKEVALVLKAMYDLDILEEEAITEWFDSKAVADGDLPSFTQEAGSAVRKYAKPFVEWLRTADEEESEEEDD